MADLRAPSSVATTAQKSAFEKRAAKEPKPWCSWTTELRRTRVALITSKEEAENFHLFFFFLEQYFWR